MDFNDIESQEVIIKVPLKSKCFEFWFEKHPICFLWMWLLSVLIGSVLISEFHK